MSEFLKKVNLVQVNLKAPKDKTNSFGNYTYRSCESILEAVKPLLKEHGLIITLEDEVLLIGDRFYVKATATVHDCDSDYSLSKSAYARECDEKRGLDSAQLTGSCSSYARKYALCGLLGIDDNKDADTDEYARHGQEKQAEKKQTEKKQTEKKQAAPVPAAQEIVAGEVHICSDCGKKIGEAKIGDSVFSAEKVCKASMKKYQRLLCMDCVNKIEGR